MKTELLVSQKEPLKKGDTKETTFGCRHTNPSICSSHSLDSVCAFVRIDSICRKPPRSWARIFEKLGGKNV